MLVKVEPVPPTVTTTRQTEDFRIESATRTVGGLSADEHIVRIGDRHELGLWLRPFRNLDALPGLADLTGSDRDRIAGITNPQRRAEFGISRVLKRHAEGLWPDAATSISHCRDWVGVAASRHGPIGLDVECKLPSDPLAIADAFGWPVSAVTERSAFLHRWTRWEAWCKFSGGSVLETDRAHGLPLDDGDAMIDGVLWLSREISGATWSVVARLEKAASDGGAWFH